MLQLTESLKLLLLETANKLKGHERRRFMALTVQELGKGFQRLAERELGWNRDLIRKGTREVETGIICLDGFQARGRKAIETKLPNLLEYLQSIVDSQSQTESNLLKLFCSNYALERSSSHSCTDDRKLCYRSQTKQRRNVSS
jgi:hypothetical protein